MSSGSAIVLSCRVILSLDLFKVILNYLTNSGLSESFFIYPYLWLTHSLSLPPFPHLFSISPLDPSSLSHPVLSYHLCSATPSSYTFYFTCKIICFHVVFHARLILVNHSLDCVQNLLYRWEFMPHDVNMVKSMAREVMGPRSKSTLAAFLNIYVYGHRCFLFKN